jgi:hypothetical protein
MLEQETIFCELSIQLITALIYLLVDDERLIIFNATIDEAVRILNLVKKS